MPSVRNLFYVPESLLWQHLPENVAVPVIIESASPVHFSDGPKLRLSFKGKRRALLANQTNCNAIAEQLGDDWSQWIGKLIYLEVSETEFEGELVGCIRVCQNPPADPASRFQF